MTKYEVIPAQGLIQESILRFNENGTIDSIPTDLANSDYQAYLASLEKDAK